MPARTPSLRSCPISPKVLYSSALSHGAELGMTQGSGSLLGQRAAQQRAAWAGLSSLRSSQVLRPHVRKEGGPEMLSLCPHPPLGKETGDSSAGKNGPEMVPREAQPGSAGGGGCGGGVPGWRPTGLLLRKRPWRGPVALQLSRPPVFSPGLVGWLPSWVSLQQQNQGQSSWLSLHFPTVCLRLSCPSISLSHSLQSPTPLSCLFLLSSL